MMLPWNLSPCGIDATATNARFFSARFDQLFRPNGHVFYGWWIVMAGALQLLSSLLWMQSYGAYVVLLQDEFGWSKTLIAGAFAMTRIERILGPLQDWMVDRYGPRIVLQFGTVMYGVGFMLFSQIDSVLGFYLTFALIAVGSSLGGFATLMVAVVSWFHRHRSKSCGDVTTRIFGRGFVSVVVLALENFGWRETAFVSGIIVIVIGLPLAQVIRHRPESFGEVPDGISGRSGPRALAKIDSARSRLNGVGSDAHKRVLVDCSRSRYCTVVRIDLDGAFDLASDHRTTWLFIGRRRGHGVADDRCANHRPVYRRVCGRSVQ